MGAVVEGRNGMMGGEDREGHWTRKEEEETGNGQNSMGSAAPHVACSGRSCRHQKAAVGGSAAAGGDARLLLCAMHGGPQSQSRRGRRRSGCSSCGKRIGTRGGATPLPTPHQCSPTWSCAAGGLALAAAGGEDVSAVMSGSVTSSRILSANRRRIFCSL